MENKLFYFIYLFIYLYIYFILLLPGGVVDLHCGKDEEGEAGEEHQEAGGRSRYA
jgi:hypothetical protein